MAARLPFVSSPSPIWFWLKLRSVSLRVCANSIRHIPSGGIATRNATDVVGGPIFHGLCILNDSWQTPMNIEERHPSPTQGDSYWNAPPPPRRRWQLNDRDSFYLPQLELIDTSRAPILSSLQCMKDKSRSPPVQRHKFINSELA